MAYRLGKTREEVNVQVNNWMLKGQPSEGRMSFNILKHTKTGYTEAFFVNDTAADPRDRICYPDRSALQELTVALKQEPVTEFTPSSKL